jgi:putative holliday junction resolvase
MEINSFKTYIGLDVGERRIGVARVNSLVRIAEPLEHIDTKSDDTLGAIKNIILQHQADGVVVGLPRGLDGQETQQTKYCRDFADKLKKNVAIQVYLIDEAGTSKSADDKMSKDSKQSRDSVAASILLEDFVAYTQKESLEV